MLQEGNSPPISVNLLAGKDENLGLDKEIFRDSIPEYGIVKLYILLTTFAKPVFPSGEIKIILAPEGVLVSPAPYGVDPVTFNIFF